jgi:hypothetical protein
MEITYNLDAQDYSRYTKVLASLDAATRARLIVGGLGVPLIVVLYFLLLPSQLPAVLALAVLLLALIPVMRRRAINRLTSAPGALGVRTLRLDVAGIRLETTCGEMRVRWADIMDIVDAPEMVILLMGPRSGHFVPKMAFPDPVQAQAFVASAIAYRQAAVGGTEPVLPESPDIWPPPPGSIRR